MKAKGHPLGQTLGHAFGDANAFWYPYLWSWGGKEVEADGKTVVLDSKDTIESVKFAIGFWKDAFDEGAFAWDDAGNNRAFLADTISSTNNGASIYLDGQEEARHLSDRDGKPLKDDSSIRRCPKARPASSAITCRSRHGDELFAEPEGGEGLPALVPLQGRL